MQLQNSTWIKKLTSQNTDASVFYCLAPSAETLMHLPMLFGAVRSAAQQPIINLAVREKSLRNIKAILETSFLGSTNWYGIYDLEQCSKQDAAALCTYLMQYRGPHTLIICFTADFSVPAELKKKALVIPSELSGAQIAELCSTILLPSGRNYTEVMQSLANKSGQISLEQFLVSLPYAPMVNKFTAVAFKVQYLPRLINADAGSLFAFTDLLWQKKRPEFYATWARFQNLYTPHFWISFWSDQFFRAACYAQAMHKNDTTVANSLAARKLSFFYIKTGWRSANVDLLISLHDALYRIDYLSKTGSTTDMIEYVYQQWFDS
jgi:hypothetical protein